MTVEDDLARQDGPDRLLDLFSIAHHLKRVELSHYSQPGSLLASSYFFRLKKGIRYATFTQTARLLR
jgi:hypothetical protein